jgi:hypothetical protein
MKLSFLSPAAAIALGWLCTTSTAYSQVSAPFDLVYKDGQVTELPFFSQLFSADYNSIDPSPIFEGYVGNSFIYSSYNSLGEEINNAFYVQNPATNYLGITTTGSNQFGQTVGYHEPIAGISGQPYLNGFIYSNGSFATVTASYNFTIPEGINDLGEVVGSCGCTGPNSIDGFLYSGGKFTVIDVPGAYATELFGINDYGEIVGAFYLFANSQYSSPFVYSNGNYIGIPGAYLGAAIGINDLGDVVGWGASGPVPEPSTWAMMLIGFAGLGYAGYRRASLGGAQVRPLFLSRLKCYFELRIYGG